MNNNSPFNYYSDTGMDAASKINVLENSELTNIIKLLARIQKKREFPKLPTYKEFMFDPNMVMSSILALLDTTDSCTSYQKYEIISQYKIIFSMISKSIHKSDDILMKQLAIIKILIFLDTHNSLSYKNLDDFLSRKASTLDIEYTTIYEFFTENFSNYQEGELYITTVEVNGLLKHLKDSIMKAELIRFKSSTFEAVDFAIQYNEESLTLLLKGVFELFTSRMRQYQSSSEDTERDLTIGTNTTKESTQLVKVMSETISELNSPNNFLISGMKLHDMQLGGGFQLSRLYLFIAKSGGGKSIHQLRLLKQFWEYNAAEILPSGMKYGMCYLGMENSQTETIERFYDVFEDPIATGAPPFKTLSSNDVVKLFIDNPKYNNPSKFALEILYRKNKSMNTADLDSLLDELEVKKGIIIKVLFLDYTKRINPVNKTGDTRIDLGNVIDELTSIAKTRNIIIITSGQMNGSGMELIEKAVQEGNLNVLEKAGSAVIGESKLMIENSDFVILQNTTQTSFPNNPNIPHSYLTLKIIKKRGKGELSIDQQTVHYPFLTKGSPNVQEDTAIEGFVGVCGDLDAKISELTIGNVQESRPSRIKKQDDSSGKLKRFKGNPDMALVDVSTGEMFASNEIL